jgi:hypothetical protein
MRLPLIKYGNIALTIITIHRAKSPLCLLLQVRLGGYIVNSLALLLFLQAHRETDSFFASSRVQLAQHDRGLFHFRRAAFSATMKAKVGSTLAKAASLRITLNIDGAPITSRTRTHPSHSQTSRINLVFIFRCSSSRSNPVYARRVDFSALVFSLSSHRHSYIGLVFRSHFLDS